MRMRDWRRGAAWLVATLLLLATLAPIKHAAPLRAEGLANTDEVAVEAETPAEDDAALPAEDGSEDTSTEDATEDPSELPAESAPEAPVEAADALQAEAPASDITETVGGQQEPAEVDTEDEPSDSQAMAPAENTTMSAGTASLTIIGGPQTDPFAPQTWLTVESIAIEDGDTGRTILDRETARAAMRVAWVDSSWGPFLSAITNKDNETLTGGESFGGKSSWSFAIGDQMAAEGLDTYAVKDGDALVVFFTPDYVLDQRVIEWTTYAPEAWKPIHAVSLKLIGGPTTEPFAPEIWLDIERLHVLEGSTAKAVLDAAAADHGFTPTWLDTDYGPMLTAIDMGGGKKLSGGVDFGANSSWMYAIGDKMAPVGVGAYEPAQGDELIFFFSPDYSNEPRISADWSSFNIDGWTAEEEPQEPSEPDAPDAPVEGPADPSLVGHDWFSFRQQLDNNARVGYALPLTEPETELVWKTRLRPDGAWDGIGDPLIVDGKLFVAVGSELLRLSLDGNVEARASLPASVGYTARPVGLGGFVYVPLEGGGVVQVDRITMAIGWQAPAVNDTPGQHQNLSTLVGDRGRIVYATTVPAMGSSESGVVICLDAATGDVLWRHVNESKGYYWSGAVLSDSHAVIAGDDGEVLSLDLADGSVMSRVTLSGPARATLVRDGNALYAVSLNGELHRLTLGSDGTLAIAGSVRFADYSTSTPVIARGRIYVGGADGGAGVLAVIDAERLERLHVAKAPNNVQGSVLVSTSEADSNVAYLTSNGPPGALYVFHDPLDASQTRSAEVEVLYLPIEAEQNWNLSSPLASADGTLYYMNDSGMLFALRRTAEATPPTSSDTEETTGETKPTSSRPTVTDAPLDDTGLPRTGTDSALPGIILGVLLVAVAAGILVLLLRRRRR